MLWRTSRNVWQTSLLGQLHITSNSTLEKLNSSSSQGKTALTWTCQSLSRMSRYRLHQWWGATAQQHHYCGPIFALCNPFRIQSFLTKYAMQLLLQAPVISHLDYCYSLLAGLPTSAFKLLQLIQNAAVRFVYNLPNSSMWPTSSVTSTGFLLRPASYSRRWCWPSRPSTELHLSTSKHWSDHTPQREHFTLLTSDGRLLPPSLRANKAHSAKSQLFSVLEPQWWNELLTNVRTTESLSIFIKILKTHLFRLHLEPQSMTPSPPLSKNFNNVYTCMFIS